MKFLFILCLALSINVSQANENVCNETKSVCVMLHHGKDFVTTEASTFMVHIMTADHSNVSDFKLDLWMPMHGHGSRPVVIKDLGGNAFDVTEAYFVMKGSWLVRTTMKHNGKDLEIDLPVVVK